MKYIGEVVVNEICYSVCEEDGTLYAGTPTNTGLLVEATIPYDPNLTMDENVSEIYGKLELAIYDKEHLIEENYN